MQKDTTTVLELKKIIEGILKVSPPNQMLFNKDSQLMEDDKTLAEYGLTSATAKAQCPAPIGLALRKENGEFEALDLVPYSSPPDLPDVMKSQETNGQEQLGGTCKGGCEHKHRSHGLAPSVTVRPETTVWPSITLNLFVIVYVSNGGIFFRWINIKASANSRY
ncbi:Elongin-B [Eumeta japonica]|uniref:Elongin-B n=1 Tax=Eumeta variegata TaxID=151549 RepID=A0A4C1ZCP3_EUMVA|nr:Elongin-B [Eumeta japonica]